MAKTKAKKVKKRSAVYAPLTFLVVCAALVFSVGVFFRVAKIEVSGGTYYSVEEVIEASGIEEGDNLFFVNRFTSESRIYSRLPYVQSVSVSRALPNRIIIEVYEGGAVACVRDGADYWLIDKYCKLLQSGTAADAQGLINITGVTPASPVIGETLLIDSGDSTAVEYISGVLCAMSALDMLGDVTFLDLSNISDPSFDYLGRFTVKPGRDETAQYKLELMLSAVEQLGPGDEGLLDLSIDKKVHFSPY